MGLRSFSSVIYLYRLIKKIYLRFQKFFYPNFEEDFNYFIDTAATFLLLQSIELI